MESGEAASTSWKSSSFWKSTFVSTQAEVKFAQVDKKGGQALFGESALFGQYFWLAWLQDFSSAVSNGNLINQILKICRISRLTFPLRRARLTTRFLKSGGNKIIKDG